MSADGYQTVFDVTMVGFKSWKFPAVGLIFVAIGLVLPSLINSGKFRRMPGPAAKWFRLFFLGFAIFWTVTSFVATFSDYRKSVDAMVNGQAAYIEGAVTEFRPMPSTGHSMESFVVQGVRFEYSDYIITAGFNHTASHGGPIRDGLLVRIWHRSGEILRLDIKAGPNHPTEPLAPRHGG
jgi:hypothetical protein